MYYSWGSMLRTVRAAVAVMILGGIGLTVPPQTRDMLAFLDNGRFWPSLADTGGQHRRRPMADFLESQRRQRAALLVDAVRSQTT